MEPIDEMRPSSDPDIDCLIGALCRLQRRGQLSEERVERFVDLLAEEMVLTWIADDPAM